MIFVTGGAGFIGTNFIINLLNCCDDEIVNIDKLTYAGNFDNFKCLSNENKKRLKNYQVDILDKKKIKELFSKYKPNVVFNLAAESHVDRSIHSPLDFINTNILGTFNILNASLEYYLKHDLSEEDFRFIHVSTDEVYGDLHENDPPFNELSQYRPNSPYSASKASSDHLVRSFYKTYKLPTITSNCSNNFGPYQSSEKFIPKIIINALQRKKIPIYGKGLQIRDWLYVDDHAIALYLLSRKGIIGETYCIGGGTELSNIDLAELICKKLDEIKSLSNDPHQSLIEFVDDRAGHDFRYSIDSSKMINLGWMPQANFEDLLEKTISWYIDNMNWVDAMNLRK